MPEIVGDGDVYIVPHPDEDHKYALIIFPPPDDPVLPNAST
jgi:hypothetical protein